MSTVSRPFGLALFTLTIVVAATSAHAAARSTGKRENNLGPSRRVEKYNYSVATGVNLLGPTYYNCVRPYRAEDSSGCFVPIPRPQDRTVTFEVADSTGTATGFMVRVRQAQGERYLGFCGSTPKPIRLPEGAQLELLVSAIDIEQCDSLGTSGTVTATFRS